MTKFQASRMGALRRPSVFSYLRPLPCPQPGPRARVPCAPSPPAAGCACSRVPSCSGSLIQLGHLFIYDALKGEVVLEGHPAWGLESIWGHRRPHPHTSRCRNQKAGGLHARSVRQSPGASSRAGGCRGQAEQGVKILPWVWHVNPPPPKMEPGQV